MAEFEIASMLEALAVDTHRCAPVTASVIRRRGDRRRVAVRAMASASTVALVGATAGTAYAVDHGSGRASLRTGTLAAGHHPSPRPVPPSPVPATRHERVLIHKLHVARKQLHHERAARIHLHRRHRAGDIGDAHFQERLAQLNNRIAATREHIASLRARLDQALAKSAAARPAAAPSAATGSGTVQCQDATSPGSAAPTPVPSPTPTSVTCDTESGRGTAMPTPSPSPTSK